MQKSKFIVLEGIDGSGKTYMCNIIKLFLKQQGIKNIIIVRQPGSTPLSEWIRKIIKSNNIYEKYDKKTILLLMYAARIQLVQNIIQPALKKNIWVISDRHDLSSLAYQGGGFKIKTKNIVKLKKIAIGSFQPDLTIYLDVIPKIAIQRICQRNEKNCIETINTNFLSQVRKSYLKNISKHANSITINANLKINIVKQDIKNKLKKWLQKHAFQ